MRDHADMLTHLMPAAFCLTNIAVLNVDAGRRDQASTVRIEDGVIAAVGVDGTVDCDGLAAIDGSGHTLMPGLWDMHVHTSADDGPLHLAAGVTSARIDIADIDEIIRVSTLRMSAMSYLLEQADGAPLPDGFDSARGRIEIEPSPVDAMAADELAARFRSNGSMLAAAKNYWLYTNRHMKDMKALRAEAERLAEKIERGATE